MRVGGDLTGTVCASCGKQLTDGRLLVWDGPDVYHQPCHTLALRQYAEAGSVLKVEMDCD